MKKLERKKFTQPHKKENTNDLNDSAFGLSPQITTKRKNFINKHGEYKGYIW